MELKGKRICFLGDSITQGYGVSCPENVYWQVFGRNTGANVWADGIGGSRYARQPQVTEFTGANRHFLLRVADMPAAADAVVVFGGVNDFAHGNGPLGSMADREDTTFYGAVHSLCLGLLERYPCAEIVLATPLHCGREAVRWNYSPDPVRNVATLGQYAQVIREVAEYYSLPLFDLYRMGGLTPELPITREQQLPDWLHPNDFGHARIARRLEGFLRML